MHSNWMNIMRKITYFVLLLLLFSCNATKTLQDNEYLLTKNAVVIKEDKDAKIVSSEKKRLSSEMLPLASQAPNNKFLFMFKPRLAIYNSTVKPKKEKRRIRKGKEPVSNFTKWVREKLGEAPVVFDSIMLSTSEERMTNYLINQGYFNAQVSSSFDLSHKKSSVTFRAEPRQRFYFNNLFYEIDDDEIEQVVKAHSKDSHIQQNEPYTTDALKFEQERIADILNNNGFFSFTRNNVVFEVDTSGESLYKDVYLQIKRDDDDLARKQYKVGVVTFNINYANTSLKRKDFHSDTLRNLHIYHSSRDIRSDIIAQSIFYQPDSTFKKDDYRKTISRLNDLGIFKFVNIKYQPLLVSQTEGYVDTEIVAELRKRQSGKIELETNTDAKDKIGTFVSFSYTNKNIFKRADRLQISVSNGVEFRFSNLETEKEKNTRISAVNVIANARLYFPKIFPQTRRAVERKNYKPMLYPRSTFVNLGYNFQRRLGYYSYSVNTFNLGYGYDISKKNMKHEFQPFNMSFIKPREASFNHNFNEFLRSNPIFAQSYRQQFIMGQEYIFTYSNQDISLGDIKSFFYYRGMINTAGNLVYGLQSLVRDKPEGGFELSGLPYASFTKVDNDFRYYFTFKNKTTLVARAYAGVGIPYGNSNIIPFIKQYAAGGPQSMRGWNYRGLGPGSADTSITSLDLNTGDIQLEFNLEYRFNLNKIFKMALFTDAGNVWLMRKDESMPNAEFNFKRLAKDMAWSAGFGFRLDFGLFVIRLDHSYKLYSPNIEHGKKWITQYPGYSALNPDGRGRWNDKWKSWRSRYSNFVIGIGYPF